MGSVADLRLQVPLAGRSSPIADIARRGTSCGASRFLRIWRRLGRYGVLAQALQRNIHCLFMNDLRFAFRQLQKNPGFTAVVVLTLALGIGANTAIFSFVNAILLRPLPYKTPERLVMVFTSYLQNGSHKNWVAAPALDEWRKQTTVFEGLAARSFGGFILTGKGQPENISGSRFSANIFRLLGIQPLLGRDFLPEEEAYGRDHVVLLSHELWRQRFGGDPAIVGQTMTLDDESYTVIGVMPPRTFFPERETQRWTPLA